MQYQFPAGLYTDVRIEHFYSTQIVNTLASLDECRVREYSTAFIRIYDGNRWYYASTSDVKAIQSEIDGLARLAEASENLQSAPIFLNFSTEKGQRFEFTDCKVSDVPLNDKLALLNSLMPFMKQDSYIKFWQLVYQDEYKLKEYFNSKGADLSWDFQRAGFSVVFMMAEGEQQLQEAFQWGRTRFDLLNGYEQPLAALLSECDAFLIQSCAVEPGVYTVVLAPTVTGVFAHECFGHKSEADFMVGDEEAIKEWTLGKRVGPTNLSIVDTGLVPGSGYVPFDDEGNLATKTYLVKDGILSGRLHDAASAADLGEAVTGNARAINFEYEPIVRMTTTYIEVGDKPADQLISELEDGIYVKRIMHGSGMSTFTFAPTLAYTVKGGKIGQPVRISVVSGNVFEALENIDGIADDLEMAAFVTGGCGKMDQFPLPVGFGGPHIRVQNMQVQ